MSRLDPLVWSTAPHFSGKTYSAPRDHVRLTGQLDRVYTVMRDGTWRTLELIQAIHQRDTLPAISARLRDLRKARFGGHTVERKSMGGGLWVYRLIVRRTA